jgi:hypothetical protein
MGRKGLKAVVRLDPTIERSGLTVLSPIKSQVMLPTIDPGHCSQTRGNPMNADGDRDVR